MIIDRATADAVYRQDLGAFVARSLQIINPGADFTPAWHIDALTWKLKQMASPGRINRLVINLPPRTLKSTIVSVCFVAWLLGHDPKLKFICASFEDSLARKFSRDTRTLMESEYYRRLFPGTRINPRKSTETEFETTAGGYRFATSVGGSLTGRGGDYLIVDDPIKPQDTDSETIRQRCNDWFDKTLMSRQEKLGKSRILVLMQRLHAYDLSGLLLERGWPLFIIPAIATERSRYALGGGRHYTRKQGELLQPGRDSSAEYENLRNKHGSRMFEAQYQQNPTPPDGNLIRREWLKRYSSSFSRSACSYVVLTCDPAGKPGPNNDYTAIAIGGVRNNLLHLLDIHRGHWTVLEMMGKIVSLANHWRAGLVIVEDTSSGSGLIQLLNAQTRLNVVGKHPTENKEIRLLRQQGVFEAARILLPEEAPWLAAFESELLAFPSGRYDDQVDAVLMTLEWFADLPPEIPFFMPVSIPRGDDLWDRFGYWNY
jgi:predicted phage terminase large subunit-like protein